MQDYADIAQKMAELIGMEAQDWQLDVIRDWSAIGADGKFVHKRNGGSIPRQAGKSVSGIIWAAILAAFLGYTVLWTDHNYSTTTEMLKRFRDIFGKRPKDPHAPNRHFNKLLVGTNNKTAQEAMFFQSGGSLHFATRTKSSSLGYSFDVVVYDEAQELTDEQQQAIIPTTTSGKKKNPQAIYLGTPPRPNGYGDVFEKIRSDALEGGNAADDLSWWEWSTEEVGDVFDEARYYKVNPSLGRVASVEALRAAARSMSALAFAQEYLGYWLPKGRAKPAISAEKWDACATDEPPMDGAVVYAVKFSPDGEVGALAGCVRDGDGKPHVEVIDCRPTYDGVGWLSDWLIERSGKAARVVIDGKANAEPLKKSIDRFFKRRAVTVTNPSQVSDACALLLNAVNECGVTHYAQPELDDSATKCPKRPIGNGGGWGFAATSDADPTLVEACALALWGMLSAGKDPTRKSRVYF